MRPLTFTVFGVPQPQGSARAFTYKRSAEKGGGIGARVDSDNPKLKTWRKTVAAEALIAAGRERVLTHGPVRVVLSFYLHRPKYLGAKSAPHVTRPDIDKLARGILDALTSVFYADDAQVVKVEASKEYARLGESPRVVITVIPFAQGELLYGDNPKEVRTAGSSENHTARQGRPAALVG